MQATRGSPVAIPTYLRLLDHCMHDLVNLAGEYFAADERESAPSISKGETWHRSYMLAPRGKSLLSTSHQGRNVQ